eukprot:CAMPEP_0177606428 /NCGR_PEP_ID=MMETSP0419_2-20121207/17303_1 /TAXON_ID=582737 /ORGANISM="Tetraselmis sp., Strain GSL018" /LENGTH=453 /DNA_ID=CAMNT_0019100791 /DNA_START=327 /DNA_END=1685 /DNA_ORIENTATION=+
MVSATQSYWTDDSLVLERYDLGRRIGVGGFSTVFEAHQRSTGNIFAAKVVKLTSRAGFPRGRLQRHNGLPVQDVINEALLLSMARHRSVVKLEEFFVENSYVVLILEHLKGGVLADIVAERGCLTEEDCRLALKCVLEGVDCLHTKGILHRDLKLENLVLASSGDFSSTKVCDFGLAVPVDKHKFLQNQVIQKSLQFPRNCAECHSLALADDSVSKPSIQHKRHESLKSGSPAAKQRIFCALPKVFPTLKSITGSRLDSASQVTKSRVSEFAPGALPPIKHCQSYQDCKATGIQLEDSSQRRNTFRSFVGTACHTVEESRLANSASRSQPVEEGQGTSCCGTLEYMAPELLCQHGKRGWSSLKPAYSCKSDMWSVGIILYYMLSGSPPFRVENDVGSVKCESEVITKICKGQWGFDDPIWELVSDEAKDLVQRLLCMRPRSRLSAAEALNHPW